MSDSLRGGAISIPTDGRKVEIFLKAISRNTSVERISALFPYRIHKYTLNDCQRLHSDRLNQSEYNDFYFIRGKLQF